MKGIILAGGKATRLYPITKCVSKQMLPVYDKPMIYYPLSILMLAGIRDILIISNPFDLCRFENLLGDGHNLGIKISYEKQNSPRGIADAFLVGEKFIGKENVCLILGDNIFYGDGLTNLLIKAASLDKGAVIFGYYVNNPQAYGVIEFDGKCKPRIIVEKPKKIVSNWAVTGLYFYDNSVIEIAKKNKPSLRGELEITDINNVYLKRKQLHVELFGRGYAWLDTGTYDSLIDASVFIKTIEERQGLKIGCIEEIAYRKKYINRVMMKKLALEIKTSYGEYLLRVLKEDFS